MPQLDAETLLLRERLAKDIVGEIVLAERPEEPLKKWRAIFHVSQKDLATRLGITSSVISDYESGRRQSPGIKVIKKYITALLDLDATAGGSVVKGFSKTVPSPLLGEAVLDIQEFAVGVPLQRFCERINAQLLTKSKGEVYGYTVIDSLKAITEFSASELVKLYGLTTQRALIFTKVTTGRTPMVAIKLTNLRPGLVVLHGLQSADEIARRIAEAENIPLAVCRLEKAEDIVAALRRLA
ncbi:MAG TPA: helix-turn-helix domain-containing protein [archaeon]|nr:helix-turn-helix domain-containing protein [archaeon]